VVVVVTGYAAFPAYGGGGMVPFVLVDAGFQFGMAGQAFGIGHLVAEFVALGAVRQPLQVRMYGSQRSGGYLRNESRRTQDGQDQKGYCSCLPHEQVDNRSDCLFVF
jgi:hypothetical protein